MVQTIHTDLLARLTQPCEVEPLELSKVQEVLRKVVNVSARSKEKEKEFFAQLKPQMARLAQTAEHRVHFIRRWREFFGVVGFSRIWEDMMMFPELERADCKSTLAALQLAMSSSFDNFRARSGRAVHCSPGVSLQLLQRSDFADDSVAGTLR